MALDGALCLGVLWGLVYERFGTIDPPYSDLGVLSLLLMLISYNFFGVYHFYANAIGSVLRLTKAWGIVVFTLLFLAFATKTSALYSRELTLLWVSGAYALQLVAHLLVPSFLREANLRNHRVRMRAIVIGAGKLGWYLARRINANPWVPVQVVGVVDDDPEAVSKWNMSGVPVLGGITELSGIIDRHEIACAYIAMPLSTSPLIEGIYACLAGKFVDIYWAPDVFGLNPVNLSIKEVGGVPLIALSETPLLGAHKWLKAMEDRLLAMLLVVVLSPLMLLVAILITCDSPGPVLFKQRRHGWNGKIIEVWKFRTMYVSGANVGQVKQASRDDPRVTRIGRYLRRMSLDELPQLFNVLQGTMSLVGPRPHAIEHDKYYAKRIGWYVTRHRIKPGMTGLAQVKGFRGETETIEKMAQRVELDLEYINNWSVGLDLWILVRTVFALWGKNAY
jgi:putative colanic acid biosynthesis UDP-glucose lipid carrier transferase